MNVSRETDSGLSVYADLIKKWNPRINLVSSASLQDLDQRHFADCLQLAELAAPEGGSWVDLGSGGGLPGIVLALGMRETSTRFIFVESDQRKCAFLRTAIRELNLENCQVIADRIESVAPLKAAYLSARALAPLPRLMPYLAQHLARNGQAWLMKGRHWHDELDQATREWRFSVNVHASKTDTAAAILNIWGLEHV